LLIFAFTFLGEDQPAEILAQMCRVLMQDLPIVLEGPSKVCLFTYDNDTAIVHSLLPHPTQLKLVVKQSGAKL
jgi:hypothetical protein